MGKGSLWARLGLVRRPPLTLEEFRERIVDEVLSREPGFELERVGDDELRYGQGGYATLARGYAYFRERPRELEIVIGQLADGIVYEPRAAKPDELIVLVRPTTFQAGDEGKEDRGLAQPLPGGLIAVVAVDTPSSYVFSTAAELRKELGMDDAQIWDRARANLRERLDMTPPAFRTGRVLGIKTEVGLASSFLLEDSFWEHPDLSCLGAMVVAPLERDELLVAPLAEPDLVQALRNIVARRDSSEFLCDRLLLRRNGAWEDFE